MNEQKIKDKTNKIKTFLNEIGAEACPSDHDHYNPELIQIKPSEENLLKMVKAQKKFGGVLCIQVRELADKMIELGYKEVTVVTDDMKEDFSNFNKVDYFLGPNYYFENDNVVELEEE